MTEFVFIRHGQTDENKKKHIQGRRDIPLNQNGISQAKKCGNFLKNNGYEAMLYSSKFYLENVWMHFDNSKICLAHYTDKTDYDGEYMMWQMTSAAKVNGITENTVDIDILYK